MVRSALKSAHVNAPRFRLTVLAVILSVAFLTATLVLTASMTGTANDDIASANWGVDAVVEGRILVEGEGWAGEAAVDTRGALPSDAVSVVSYADGVAATAKVIRGFAKLVDDGLALGDSSALDVGRNWITDRNLNPFEITAGAAPTAQGEVAIDLALAREGGLAVGDPIQVLTSTGLHDATITGLATYGGADAEPMRRTTLFAGSVTAEVLGEPDVSEVLLTFAEDADSSAVVRRCRMPCRTRWSATAPTTSRPNRVSPPRRTRFSPSSCCPSPGSQSSWAAPSSTTRSRSLSHSAGRSSP